MKQIEIILNNIGIIRTITQFHVVFRARYRHHDVERRAPLQRLPAQALMPLDLIGLEVLVVQKCQNDRFSKADLRLCSQITC